MPTKIKRKAGKDHRQHKTPPRHQDSEGHTDYPQRIQAIFDDNRGQSLSRRSEIDMSRLRKLAAGGAPKPGELASLFGVMKRGGLTIDKVEVSSDLLSRVRREVESDRYSKGEIVRFVGLSMGRIKRILDTGRATPNALQCLENAADIMDGSAFAPTEGSHPLRAVLAEARFDFAS